MLDTGTKLFGFPVHICEQGESLHGDKNLPAVKVPRKSADDLGDRLCEQLLPTATHNDHPAPVCPKCLHAYPSGDDHECSQRGGG